MHNFTKQAQLERVIRDIFNGEEIHTNARRIAKVISPDTKYSLELDIWVPKWKICFEFQDEYHYNTTWYSQLPLDSVKSVDKLKQVIVKKREDTLCEVPYWWDGSKERLIEAILFQRPDLKEVFLQKLFLKEKENYSFGPTPLNPPSGFVQPYGHVKGVGELMLASFPPLAYNFGRSLSALNPWWMGEKYDGINCCWNPIVQRLYARSGMDLSFPSIICNHFPPAFLNGELWCGRGGFAQAQQMIHSLNEFDFSCLRVMVFDDAKPGKFFKRTFESRYRSLVDNVDTSHPFIILAPRMKCQSEGLLNLFVRNILSDGGEGTILRRPRSVYEHGRSNHLVKIKASRADREALVVSVHSNELVLKLSSGVTFTVPRLEQEEKVKKGDIVTCSYDQVTTNSIPVDPKITKIRSDLTWKDVLLNSDSLGSHLNESSQKLFPEAKDNLVATINNNKRRKFFENFAKQNNLDPLVPETWYSVSRRAITSLKESGTVLAPFKYSVVRALIHLFPEIIFDESKFILTQRAHWINLTHRKQFFDDFAKRNNFDPLVPENWHSVFSEPIMATKGVSSVLQYYSGNIRKALMHLYPNIGLDPVKFIYLSKNYWLDEKNRKSFFVDFAKKKGFDPHVSENWLHIPVTSIYHTKRGTMALRYYNGSLISAVKSLFP